jgi:hypothetical protein
MKENEKHLDLELLLFFIFISFVTFFFYVFRHPLFPALVIGGGKSNIYNLFKAYLPDMIVYLSVFIPYIIIIISLIIYKLVKKNKISKN